MPKKPKLMIPGPVDVWEETLDALGEPVYPYYGPAWGPIYEETLALLKHVMLTEQEVLIMTASGSGAVEAGLANLFSPGNKVAVVSNGYWAKRIKDILTAYRCQIVSVDDEWGQPADVDKMRTTLEQQPDIAGITVVANETSTGLRNPVQALAQLAHEHDIPILVDAISALGGYHFPIDEWGLDVVCTSSNKALELPPGLGILSVSERAWEIIEAKKDDPHRGWYFNLSTWKSRLDEGIPSPNTMATSLIIALRASLKRILEVETLEGHWARYAWAQRVLRAGLRNIGFEMLTADEHASTTVTAVLMRDDIANEKDLRNFMYERHNFMLGSIGGPLAGRVIRIGHMGKAGSQEYLVPCLLGIEDYLRRMKQVDVPAGASLVGLAAEEVWY